MLAMRVLLTATVPACGRLLPSRLLRCNHCSAEQIHRAPQAVSAGSKCRREVENETGGEDSGWQRYAIAVQYEGHGLGGSSGRPRAACNGAAPSVQEVIESALDKFVGEGNHRHFQFSSRTDAGVHALRNTLHVDLRHLHKQLYGLRAPHAPRTVQRALNHYLAGSAKSKRSHHKIGVVDVRRETNTFHARFDAKSRSYVYRMIVRPRRIQHNTSVCGKEARATDSGAKQNVCSSDDDMDGSRSFNGVFTRDTAWLIAPPGGGLLDVASMQTAASELLGTHDFTSFRSAGCQARSPVKTLDVVDIHARVLELPGRGDGKCVMDQLAADPMLYCRKLEAGLSPDRGGAVQEILIVVKARSFMYNQVRNIVGFLVDVGQAAAGTVAAGEAARSLLQKKDRRDVPYVKAPAQGLALINVEYE